MKANEAPEKLYIDSREHWMKSWTAFTTKAKGNDIEYTRTDAFIEKACEWLSKHAIKYYLDGSKFLGTDELVEDFKIAMKI